MDIGVNGLDDLEDAIDDMLGDLSLGEENEIPLEEMFTPEFMGLYTEFQNIEQFFEASPWEVNSEEDFEEIPEEEFDQYVSEHTDFPNWGVMQETAGKRYLENQLS